MRTSWSPFSLLVVACLLGCSTQDVGSSASANVTTDPGEGTTTASTTDTGGTDSEGDGEGICKPHCMLDADCFVSGYDLGLMCVDGRCDSPDCTSDEECVARLSGWAHLGGSECTPGGGECTGFSDICLDVFGEGQCVYGPSDTASCEDLFLFEIETVDIDGNPVVVCGQPNAICTDEGYCKPSCKSDADCLSDIGPICNVDTGNCMCGTDADCENSSSPASVVCTMAGPCGCTEDQQCVDANLGDACNSEGRCVCTNDMACANYQANPYDGGTVVCEGL
jgi:hypothetical protein